MASYNPDNNTVSYNGTTYDLTAVELQENRFITAVSWILGG
ncbi:MAG: hypothetical protein R2744_09045 [Bacteroidales bacterium]